MRTLFPVSTSKQCGEDGQAVWSISNVECELVATGWEGWYKIEMRMNGVTVCFERSEFVKMCKAALLEFDVNQVNHA